MKGIVSGLALRPFSVGVRVGNPHVTNTAKRLEMASSLLGLPARYFGFNRWSAKRKKTVVAELLSGKMFSTIQEKA